jgi:hypothetical protein
MACPFFYPVTQFTKNAWAVPPRAPLGDPYAGHCLAAADPYEPDPERMRRTCNLGYGRGCCERFPLDAAADAVRFNVFQTSEEPLQVQYVLEKDCWPLRYGVLEYSNGSFLNPPENDILARQAAAFMESYQRRRQA